jgi:hypothetical protein
MEDGTFCGTDVPCAQPLQKFTNINPRLNGENRLLARRRPRKNQLGGE